jgi:hypothetical protein
MDRWMDGWVNYQWIDCVLNGSIEQWIEGEMSGWMGKWIGRKMEGNGKTEQWI